MASLADMWAGWRDAGRPAPYFLLDCAGFDQGAREIPRETFAELECLFTGDLAEELEDVAPYLGQLGAYDPIVLETVGGLLDKHLGMLVLTAPAAEPPTFADLHRHFRKHNVVYGPEGQPLFFRYYDPRALLDVLETFDRAQLESFFGPVEMLVMNDRDGKLVRCWRQDGALSVAR